MGLFSATETDASAIARDYAALLLPDERVEAAFRTIRDTVFLTNYRIVLVNVQGVLGKKVDIESIPYRSVVRFSAETAGTFDLDADLKIWISGTPQPLVIKVGAKIGLVRIKLILAQYVLG